MSALQLERRWSWGAGYQEWGSGLKVAFLLLKTDSTHHQLCLCAEFLSVMRVGVRVRSHLGQVCLLTLSAVALLILDVVETTCHSLLCGLRLLHTFDITHHTRWMDIRQHVLCTAALYGRSH